MPEASGLASYYSEITASNIKVDYRELAAVYCRNGVYED